VRNEGVRLTNATRERNVGERSNEETIEEKKKGKGEGSRSQRGMRERFLKNSSSNVKLEGLKPAADCCTSRAFSPGALFSHQHIDASWAKAADAFRTGKGFPEERYRLAGCAVYLCILR